MKNSNHGHTVALKLAIAAAVAALGAVVTLQAISSPAHAGYARKFEAELQAAIRATDTVLVENGLCKSAEECPAEKILFWNEGPGGVEITIFGVTDQKILAKIAPIYFKVFADNAAMQNLKLRAYAISEKDDPAQITSVWFSDPILDINMRRQQ